MSEKEGAGKPRGSTRRLVGSPSTWSDFSLIGARRMTADEIVARLATLDTGGALPRVLPGQTYPVRTGSIAPAW